MHHPRLYVLYSSIYSAINRLTILNDLATAAGGDNTVLASMLTRFFVSLYATLRRGSRCVFQLGRDKSQTDMIASTALDCGFSGGMIVDHPTSASQRRVYLVLLAGERSNAMINRDPTIGRLTLGGTDAFEDAEDSSNNVEFGTPPLRPSTSMEPPEGFTLARTPCSPPAGGTARPSTVAVAATSTAGMPTWLSITAAQPSNVLFVAPARYVNNAFHDVTTRRH